MNFQVALASGSSFHPFYHSTRETGVGGILSYSYLTDGETEVQGGERIFQGHG